MKSDGELIVEMQKRRYPGSEGGDGGDHGDEDDVAVDLVLGLPEHRGHVGALPQLVELARVPLLLAAGPDEHVRAEQRPAQLVQRPPRRPVPPQLRDLQLPEQVADDLDFVREQLAQILVAARRARRRGDHRRYPEPVDAGHLHHARRLPQHAPQRRHAVLITITEETAQPRLITMMAVTETLVASQTHLAADISLF